MAEGKKNSTKRQTKAGMLEKNSTPKVSRKNKTTSDKEPENTPKVSKEEATDHNDDRPLH